MKYLLYLVFLVLAVIAVTGCDSDDPAAPEPKGEVVIDPSPDVINAPWTLVGPAGNIRSGTGDQTLSNLEPGDCTITWGGVDGWIAPAVQTQTLMADSTMTFTGTYEEDTRTGTVVLMDQSNPSVNAPWTLTGPNDFDETGVGDASLTGMTKGEYTVIWGEISGLLGPAPWGGTQELAPGGTITFTVSYQAPFPK